MTAPTPSLRPGTILLAEDGEDNRMLISMFLRKYGQTVTTAEDGSVAVEQAMAAWREGRPFDVILMDMDMPVLDGYGATASLRSQGYTGPIVALTAHTEEGERERCLEAGCDDYLGKPVDRMALFEMLNRYMPTAG